MRKQIAMAIVMMMLLSVLIIAPVMSSRESEKAEEIFESVVMANDNATHALTSSMPDLIITDIYIKNKKIYYKIKNQGTATAGSSHSYLYIDGTKKAEDYVSSISAGSIRTEHFDYDRECTGSEDTIKVCADKKKEVVENNGSNNCLEVKWGCVDLIITDIYGEDNKTYYEIKNKGKADAGSSYSYLYIDGSKKAEEYVGSISAGSTRTEHFNFSWKNCSGAEATVKVCVDATGTVTESDETNNCREKKLSCDLIIRDIYGEDNKIYYKIKNQGTADAGSSYSYLYVDGSKKAEEYVGSTSAGSTKTEYFDYEWNCSGSNDTIKVCADATKTVREHKETNNCREEKWCCATPKLYINMASFIQMIYMGWYSDGSPITGTTRVIVGNNGKPAAIEVKLLLRQEEEMVLNTTSIFLNYGEEKRLCFKVYNPAGRSYNITASVPGQTVTTHPINTPPRSSMPTPMPIPTYIPPLPQPIPTFYIPPYIPP